MQKYIEMAIEAFLIGTLEANPERKISDVINSLIKTIKEEEFPSLPEEDIRNTLTKISKHYVKQGVINPAWLLKTYGISLNFFLFHTQPESLGVLRTKLFSNLTTQSSNKESGISQYIIYGHWDCLLILSGTQDDAKQQLQEIISNVYDDDISSFSSHDIPYIYRHSTRDFDSTSVDPNLVNKIALDYDNEDLQNERESLKQKGILLGAVWKHKNFPEERFIAFVGINLRGLEDMSGIDMLNLLLKQDVLKKTLVHLIKVDNGRPFHFFGKLACETKEEFDRAAQVISEARQGRIRLESHTMLASTGLDQPPLYQESSIRKVGRRPLVEDIQLLAEEIIPPYGNEAVEIFNKFDPLRKLSILHALQDFQLQLKRDTWDPDWTERINRAVEIFANSVLRKSEVVHLTGAVAEITSAVEGAIKRSVRVLSEQVYGKDYAKAQNELKLSTKDFRRLSLGKCVSAFRQMKNVDAFQPVIVTLTDEWLDRIDWFTNERNIWAHDAVKASNNEEIIGKAHRVIIEGMEISRWIHSELLEASRNNSTENISQANVLNLPEEPHDREVGIFISYASQDKAIANKMATSLKAVGHKIWYDDWAIGHGDSIVSKIANGLAQNDKLIILLSPSSVQSRWVQRELNTALMRQLAGHNVKIIPIFLSDCEIPNTLLEFKYIDFRQGFQQGMITLMHTLLSS